MDIIIKSQDGKNIIKVKRIVLLSDCIYDETELLGQYNSEERAKEVVEDIFKQLKKCQIANLKDGYFEFTKCDLVYEKPKE